MHLLFYVMKSIDYCQDLSVQKLLHTISQNLWMKY